MGIIRGFPSVGICHEYSIYQGVFVRDIHHGYLSGVFIRGIHQLYLSWENVRGIHQEYSTRVSVKVFPSGISIRGLPGGTLQGDLLWVYSMSGLIHQRVSSIKRYPSGVSMRGIHQEYPSWGIHQGYLLQASIKSIHKGYPSYIRLWYPSGRGICQGYSLGVSVRGIP